MTARPSSFDSIANPRASCCHGKTPYATWRQAQRVIQRKNRVKLTRGDDTIPLVPYRCIYCGAMHIGGRT